LAIGELASTTTHAMSTLPLDSRQASIARLLLATSKVASLEQLASELNLTAGLAR
jgi:hypothetical protein